MSNKKTIEKFYSSFAANDIEGMVSCYHNEVEFEHAAFGKLHRERAKNMWRMLLVNGKGQTKVSYTNAAANDNTGSANWTAEYVFSQTGRKVLNNVTASFEFKDGKIIKHIDNFNLYAWSKQAMGFTGLLIGWTGFFKNKLQKTTNGLLAKFIEKQG